MLTSQPWRLLEHTADIRVEITGQDIGALHANAAACVFDLMVGRQSIAAKATIEVVLESSGPAELFLDWLRELLFTFSARGFAVAHVELLELDPARLRARLAGEPYDPARHGLKLELKAPTYHDYVFEKTPAGWRAVVLFDA
jgi:SHS2 domain-containing protein